MKTTTLKSVVVFSCKGDMPYWALPQAAIDGQPGSGYTEGIREPSTMEGTGEGNDGREEAYNRRGDHEPVGAF